MGKFKYSVCNNEAEIRRYLSTDENLVIPEYIDGYRVTSIGEGAFSNCHLFTSITIPDSITSIENDAFLHCTKLKEIKVGQKNSNYSSVDGVLYTKNREGLVAYPPAKQDKSFIIPEGVKEISSKAFSHCCDLIDIVISNSVTSIGDFAFYWCRNLKNVKILSAVQYIGDNAFGDCIELEKIEIPENVKYIGEMTFLGCHNLKKIEVDERNQYYTSIDGNLYTKDQTKLLIYAAGKTEPSFEIPIGVTSIGSDAFSNCRKLRQISISEGVISIDDDAFSSCTGLENIKIAASVKTIGERPFSYCTELKKIEVDEKNQYYTAIDGNLYTKDQTKLLAYAVGKTEPIFAVPYGVSSIGSNAFEGCFHLMEIILPNSIVLIDKEAFSSCSMKSIYIPDGVISIGEEAFRHCDSLTSITIPKSVRSIGDAAFLDCKELETVNISAQTRKGEWLFHGCDNLKTINISE